mgnify:CR=1 FL=1
MRGSSDESPFYVSKKRTGDEHGNLFDHGRGAVSLLLWNPLFLYRKMGLYVCQILAGGGIGHFLMIPATKEEVTRKLLFFCVAGIWILFLAVEFFIVRAMRLEERRTAGI